ncbi:uncharacterized protein LOC124139026 [Haliotis rufescens]|uniref:uncharacterized protein LOC124139026 n=1 Tax=Haliotis rufescens TaxID=6454 RepID=UPI001EB0744E|nr:uncharacterized protein LOC124139026 [Haliotis rufescens]
MALMSSKGLHEDELIKRLEKLSRNYDLATMKIFIAVESLGESLVYSTYNNERRNKWEFFLTRKEACRLDLNRHEKTREKYKQFLYSTPREEQGRQFHAAVLAMMRKKGAVDMFRHLKPYEDVESTFSGHLCKLFDKKVETWFDTFDALAVNLVAHVKVSTFTRVLNGQIDALCRRDGHLYVVNVKVTGQETPRPIDLAELCMCKAMTIQNGLEGPDKVRLSLLICHLNEDRPVLRLWSYSPSDEMEQAIREGDIDKMIDCGKLSQYHEFWKANVHLIGEVKTDRLYNGY